MRLILDTNVPIAESPFRCSIYSMNGVGGEITIIQEFVGYNWLAMKFK